jgi:hypothetical protein
LRTTGQHVTGANKAIGTNCRAIIAFAGFTWLNETVAANRRAIVIFKCIAPVYAAIIIVGALRNVCIGTGKVTRVGLPELSIGGTCIRIIARFRAITITHFAIFKSTITADRVAI